MKNCIRKGLIMMAGLVTIPAVVSHADDKLPKPECKLNDKRFQLLSRFFDREKIPVEHLTSVFIQEADANGLDWRLLPSLTIVESGGGRSSRGNNIFGWNNGNASFRTVREGIHFVAERLAHSRNYRGKSTAGKLLAYNPVEGYSENVLAVMASMSRAR